MRVAFARFVVFLALLASLGTVLAQAVDNRHWFTLKEDGVHDPKSPAIKLLQQPAESLRRLAPDSAGNQVRWMEALVKGQINPRSRIEPEPVAIPMRETDIFLNLKGGTPIVRFPHKQHTLWLDCGNCHDHLFKKEVGGTKLEMRRMLQGEQCGLCHGAVAFPLTECRLCHNTPRETFQKVQASGNRGAALAPPAPPAQPATRPPQ